MTGLVLTVNINKCTKYAKNVPIFFIYFLVLLVK